MLKGVVRQGEVLLCGTCMDARALSEDQLVSGCRPSTMDRLAQLTVDAEKVLVF